VPDEGRRHDEHLKNYRRSLNEGGLFVDTRYDSILERVINSETAAAVVNAVVDG
jgi:hypothetical protein